MGKKERELYSFSFFPIPSFVPYPRNDKVKLKKTEGQKGRNKLEKMAVKFDARKKNSRITIFRVALSPGWSHTVIINGTVTPYS